MKKQIIILFFPAIFFAEVSISQQTPFSIATDLDLQRSFKEEQRYWAIGQIAQCQFHLIPKGSIYVWFGYYAPGKFTNDLTATAKSPSINPQQISYVNYAQMKFKHFSIGWRQYIKGAFDNSANWNLYAYAGFGLMLGHIQNSFTVPIDTASYAAPILNGVSHFKRLTLDLGLGWEIPLGADIFFYNEARVFVPTTDNPSSYILVNNNAPLMGSLNIGLRFLFN